MRVMADHQQESVCITIDTRQFSREAVLKAGYWFTEDLYIEFSPSTCDDSFELVLRLKHPTPTLQRPAPKPLNELVGEFRNALIESQLRIQVQRETSGVRELLIAKAFAEAGVLEGDPPGSFGDPVLASVAFAERNLVPVQQLTPQPGGKQE